MESDFQHLGTATVHALQLGHPLTFSDAREINRISVTRGGVWLTQAQSMEDTFLQRDECFAPAKCRGAIVVEALSAGTVISLTRAQSFTTRTRAPAIALRARCAQTLRRLANALDPKSQPCLN